MALRKASAYSKRIVVPYTRKSKIKSKSYIKAVPPTKVVLFEMGERAAWNNRKFKLLIKMVSSEKVTLRDNAIESCRQYINKQLETLMPRQYYFNVVPAPHHIIRENKMITGAGADRMQKGMQLAFGRAMGRAAIIRKGDPIFFVAVDNEKNRITAKNILQSVKAKLPCTTHFVFEQLQ
jgi:large subunit ribosomal protein L10e